MQQTGGVNSSSIGARHLATLLSAWQLPGRANYQVLAERIRLLIIDGRVPTGTRLPSERELATALGVSRTTVSTALDELRASGHVHTRRGARSRVSLPLRAPAPGGVPDAIDLACAASAAGPGVHEAVTRAGARLPAFLSSPGYYPHGLPETRAAIAGRYTARGLPTDPDEILVTAGAQGAIALVARALVGQGDRILVEVPGYPNAFAAFRDAGGRLAPVPVDPVLGWPEELPDLLRTQRPALAYLTPDFQNPTGQSMPDDLRREVVAAAERNGVTLVCDEATAELDIDRPFTTRPTAAFAPRSSHVLSIGSASKAFWGGMRIGWVRAPRSVIARLLAVRPASDLGAAVFEQLLVTEILTDAETLLAQRRAWDTARRDALTAALHTTFPRWHVPDVHGGIALWVQLPAPVSSRLATVARDHGVLVPAGPRFSIDGSFERFMRLPFAAGPEELKQAITRLATAWNTLDHDDLATMPGLTVV